MKREDFINVAEETLDSLPEEFRSRIENVAILVEDFPPNQSPSRRGQQKRLLLGIFHGVPATKRSVFDLSAGPAHVVLYQKILKLCAPMTLRCVIKFARLACMNSVIISV
jgi:predicted Zn-dependent protease with MMP-like domain